MFQQYIDVPINVKYLNWSKDMCLAKLPAPVCPDLFILLIIIFYPPKQILHLIFSHLSSEKRHLLAVNNL